MDKPQTAFHRRNFVGLCALGAGGLLSAGAAGWLFVKGSVSNRTPTREDYARHINSVFHVNRDSNAVGATRPEAADLRLIEVTKSTIQSAGTRKFESYSLVFEGPSMPEANERSFELVHPTLGVQTLFLVPCGRAKSEIVRYDAIFTIFQ